MENENGTKQTGREYVPIGVEGATGNARTLRIGKKGIGIYLLMVLESFEVSETVRVSASGMISINTMHRIISLLRPHGVTVAEKFNRIERINDAERGSIEIKILELVLKRGSAN